EPPDSGSAGTLAEPSSRTAPAGPGRSSPPGPAGFLGCSAQAVGRLWLSRQRSAHRRGTLAPDRIAALDELGIDWTPGRGMADVRTQDAWQNRLDDACQYHATHGHLTPPASTIVNGRRLDAWLSVQRTRRHQGRLTPQQTVALDELAIRW
ncbi:helicase associated domain-containing protein, partial [Streptomyces sp. NPDC056004]|uniref:helicase associated domain-containing protein n=1 Tax=Streptomyces sp. NPDC056004 TaxID=3345677 RepID=UPI0035D7BA35